MISWAAEQRQIWIMESVHVFGAINRAHIQRKFRVSPAIASLDLRRFQDSNPGVIQYDPRQKEYRLVEGGVI